METKPVVCDLLRELDREKIVVVDHDTTVQVRLPVVIISVHPFTPQNKKGQFDVVMDLFQAEGKLCVTQTVSKARH